MSKMLSEHQLERWHRWQSDYVEAPDSNYMSLDFGTIRAFLGHIAAQAEAEVVAMQVAVDAAKRCLNYCGRLCETSYRCDLRAALKALDVRQEEKAK